AGVMIREYAAANAAHVVLDVQPAGSVEFMTRSSTGATTILLAGAVQPVPTWVKLVRSGTSIKGSVASDGATWQTVGTTTRAGAANALIGLVVTSHDATTLNTTTFDGVTVTAGSGG